MEVTTPVEEVNTITPTAEVVVKEIVPADPTKHAFVTMAILNDAYVAGALVLAASLRDNGSTASRVVMISSDISEEKRNLLKEVFDKVVVVPVIDVDASIKTKNDKKARIKQTWFGKVFTKLNVFNLTEFEKVVLLDADTVCASNPDALFEVTAPAGIFTNLVKASDAAFHDTVITGKTYQNAYKDQGIRGCTYVLQPSTETFDRAISLITRKPKIIQFVPKSDGFSSLLTKNDSKFAFFDDEEDEEVKQEVQQVDSSNVVGAAAEFYDEEALKAFEEAKITYPYEVFSTPEATHGFTFDSKGKTSMNADEALMVDLFKGQWRHLNARYGHASWHKSEAGAEGSVFMHYAADYPWTRTQDWPDYESWDAVAMNLIKKSEAMRSFLTSLVPDLIEKEKRGSPAAINPPQPLAKKQPKQQASMSEPAPKAEKPKFTPTTRTWNVGNK